MIRKIEKGELHNEIYEKGPNDNFTTADFVIQKMFENHLQKYFPKIKIIGEEDTTKEIVKESDYFTINENEIDFNLIKTNLMPLEFQPNLDDLVLFIDPIDSTSSLIKKKLTPCTVMIGLCINQDPFLGLLHYPFYEGKNDKTLTYFNIPSKGIFSYDCDTDIIEEVKISKRENKEVLFIASRERTSQKTLKSNIIFFQIKSF